MSVQDIRGEILCGTWASPPDLVTASHLVSFSVHSTCFHEEGVQARFSWSCRRRAGESSLSALCLTGPARIWTREGEGWRFSGNDGKQFMSGRQAYWHKVKEVALVNDGPVSSIAVLNISYWQATGYSRNISRAKRGEDNIGRIRYPGVWGVVMIIF